MAQAQFNSFRSVPKTGVIYVMSEAQRLGFSYGNSEWSNLGQGAPETSNLWDDDTRFSSIDVSEMSSEYAPVAGRMDLRQAIADLYNQRYRLGKSSKYGPENIAIAGGGRIALTRVAAALGHINLGHFLPDYTAYEELFEAFYRFVPIPIVVDKATGFRIQPELISNEILNRGLGAILLSNPTNPTGQMIENESLAEVIDICRETRCASVFDEFYSHYVYGREKPLSAAEFVDDVNDDPVVIVDGLTKNWRYPGFRVSWTLGPRDIIDSIASAGSFLDGGASHPMQKRALSMVGIDEADKQFHGIQKHFSQKKDYLVDRLKKMNFVLPGEPNGGFYCFASLENLPPSINTGMALFEQLLERKVICVPGEFFDINPGRRRQHIKSRLEGFVRFSFGPSLEELTLGLDRLESLLKSYA
ncbi:MAG: pyridoxal phosphate-dependent aminotransferase [Pseudobacteriovorax sp.]|nr:pyridoxal phosphate-dependent aminotransferase [Pseudobacteriovorax sp.]